MKRWKVDTQQRSLHVRGPLRWLEHEALEEEVLQEGVRRHLEVHVVPLAGPAPRLFERCSPRRGVSLAFASRRFRLDARVHSSRDVVTCCRTPSI